jgi:hypothetical protein
MFVVGYLAFSLPSIAAGVAVGAYGLARTTEVYGAAVIVLSLVAVGSVAAHLRRTRRTAEQACPEGEPLAA